MAGKIKNEKNKKHKNGSVLVITLILFGIMIVAALSVALVSLRQTRTSIQASKTNIAYQNADEGIDRVLTAILKGQKTYNSGNITVKSVMESVVGGKCCPDNGSSASGNKKNIISSLNCGSSNNIEFIISLYDSADAWINCDSTDDISKIYELRSSGFDLGAGTQRIVGANVQQKIKEIKLLLHADTEDGGSNFVDSSRVHHDVAAKGSVSIGTSSTAPINPNFGYINFGGSGDYLSADGVLDDWAIGSGSESPFTIDFWANFNNDSAGVGVTRPFFQLINTLNNNYLAMSYEPGTSGHPINLIDPGGTCNYSDGTDWGGIYDDKKWLHFAVIKQKNNKIKLYIEGNDVSSKFSGSCDFSSGTFNLSKILVGTLSGSSNYFYGYIDEFRFYDGEYWTTSFNGSLPTKPY